ncbi:class I tRNA ligase family protein [Candidatus Dojkabacteria bacterium]|nr:class I tRNA ligase family protein [Candidatus Dojkabacteria bacterium]
MPIFKPVDPRAKFPALEDAITKFWKENKIFEKSIEIRPVSDKYVFYDGPPFITGMPHYGHLLGSIAKDVVPRYWTMNGKRIERVWGWDCHGLPIENKVEEKIGLKNRRDIEKFGIENFVKECYKYTEETSAEWKWYIDKIGRWVDMDQAYRTMDQDYMETVIWVFKQLWDKRLVYQGTRVSLFCTRCGTPVSNFEIAMDNSYEDMEDPAVTVKFPLKDVEGTKFEGASILAWTTTPWTLPSNRALVVDENEDYVLVNVQKLEIELEKCWLIKELPKDLTKQKSSQITQAYLENFVDEKGIKPKQARIRKLDNKYTFTLKYFAGSEEEKGQLVEKIEEITKEKYIELIKQATKKVVKTRYYYPLDEKFVAEIDIYANNLEGLNVVEVEFPSIKAEQEFVVPEWFGKEVTESEGVCPPKIAEMSFSDVVEINNNFSQPEHHYEESVQTHRVILAKKRVGAVLKDLDYQIMEEFKGKELVGLSYSAPFDYYPANDKELKVYSYEGMVTMDEGTGIVHSAPGFGEIDTEMGNHYGLQTMFAVNDEGKFQPEVKDYAGMYIKDADPKIIADLFNRDLMFKAERIVHRYPYCYRCHTPLIQKAQPSWFVDIQSMKKDMLKNNENTNWVPDHLKEGRFAKGIEQAPDWGISRSRYWATPMPVWKCEKEGCDHMQVFGSRAEIEEKSGQKIENFHRPYIDEITMPCEKCGGVMKRIPEVLDVWMDSGSMPYAERHYPFENKEDFEANYPADYIVEYVGQTRAWFYTMHVISTGLFNSESFKNVIGTGVMAGTDGRKMSKTYGNYPDPKGVLETYGAEAMRMYFMGSSIMVGEDMNISEDEFKEQVKAFLLPFWNSYSFFVTYANIHNWRPRADLVQVDGKVPFDQFSNKLDQWIAAKLQLVIRNIRESMEAYNIPAAVRELPEFVNILSKWYIRRSRDRFNAGDSQAMETLYYILIEFAKAAAPFIPFLTEEIWQNLIVNELKEQPESIHLADYPKDDISFAEKSAMMMKQMDAVREIVGLGQAVRVEKGIKVRQPLAEMEINLDIQGQRDYEIEDWMKELIAEELNIKVIDEDNAPSQAEGWEYRESPSGQVQISINTNLTDILFREGIYRELVRFIQARRKKDGLNVEEKIKINITTEAADLLIAIDEYKEQLIQTTNAVDINVNKARTKTGLKLNGMDLDLEISAD